MSTTTTSAERATERVVVLMTPAQKADAARRAKDGHLSLGEFIRQRAFASEDAGDEALLAAAVSQLQESTATATASLDRALARLADARECRAEQIAQVRADARAEFAGIDPGEFADLVAGEVAPHSTEHGGIG